MSTTNESIEWWLALMDNGDGAIDVKTLTREGLREFVFWIAQDPHRYYEFRRIVLLQQRVAWLWGGRHHDPDE